MDYRPLHGTDLMVSQVCFGPMRSAPKDGGGGSTPAQGQQEWADRGRAALRSAIDAGVNFIHSSYEYDVRWMMADVLKTHPRRHELHHVIKVPVPDWEDGEQFDPVKFEARIDEALRDLGTERIALLQWMWRTKPNTDQKRNDVFGAIHDDVVAAFEKVRDKGKAGYLGTFPYTPESARVAVSSGSFSSLIAYYNPIEMEMAPLFDELEGRDMNFLAIRPLYEGVLTDKRPSWESLDEADRLKVEKHKESFRKRSAIEKAFRDVIEEEGSMTRFALRFPLYSSRVSSIIVGLNSPEQVAFVAEHAEAVAPRPDLVERAIELWKKDFGA